MKNKFNFVNHLFDPVKIQMDKLVNPLINNRKSGVVNVGVFPTGGGKTYNMISHVIPALIEEGVTDFVWITPYRTSMEQEFRDIKKFVRENGKNIAVYSDMDQISDFVNEDDDVVKIIILTTSGFSNKNSRRSVKLMEYLLSVQPAKRSIIWDEIQFGSTTNPLYYLLNVGFKSIDFRATLFNAVKQLLEDCSNNIGLTATPVWEQIPKNNSDDFKKYYHIVNQELWPSKFELSHLTSALKKLRIFPLNKKNYFTTLEDEIYKSCLYFLNFVSDIKSRADDLGKIFPELNFQTKRAMIINLSRNNTKDKFNDELECLKSALRATNLVDENLHCILVDTSDTDADYTGTYLTNLNGDRIDINPEEVQRTIINQTDNLPYIFFVTQEKGKFGLNIFNVSHLISTRERPQVEVKKKEDKVTTSPRQLNGRSSRNFYGVDFSKEKIYLIPDVIKYLIDNYSEHENFKELVEYIDLSNTHSICLPDTPTQSKAAAEWENLYAYNFKDSLFKLILNDIDSSKDYETCHDVVCSCPATHTNKNIWRIKMDMEPLQVTDFCTELSDDIINNLKNIK